MEVDNIPLCLFKSQKVWSLNAIKNKKNPQKNKKNPPKNRNPVNYETEDRLKWNIHASPTLISSA